MTALASFSGEVVNLKIEYGLKTFIETGCEDGYGLSTALLCGFERYYSCDVQESKVEHCRKIFGSLPNVRIDFSRSVNFLHNIGRDLDIDEPCMYWMDAHWPQGHGGVPSSIPGDDWPLINELCVIAGTCDTSVILIDDLRVFRDCRDYGVIEHEALRQEDYTVKRVQSLFPKHILDTRLARVAEGVLILKPKGEGQ